MMDRMDLGPLTTEQENLFREGLTTSPTLDGSQRSAMDHAVAAWADRCRRVLATLDVVRARSEWAGHRTEHAHDCFAMNCKGLGYEVARLREHLSRIDTRL